MLPFLDKKKVVTMIMGKRHPDGSIEVGSPDGSDLEGKDAAANDLIKAIHSKDAKAVVEALESIFELYDEDEEDMNHDES